MSGLLVALAGTFIFGILMAISLYAGRSWFHPAVAWNGIWFVVFVSMCFAQLWLHPVSWEALGIFVAGALYFSFGSALGSMRWRRQSPTSQPPLPVQTVYKSDRILLMGLLMLLIIGMPFYIRHIMSFSTATPFSPLFFLEVRQGMLDEAQNQSRGAFVGNLVVLSTFGTLIALAVTQGGRRWRLLIALLFGLAVVYNLLTAAKGGLLSLLVGAFAVYGLTQKRLPVKALIVLTMFVLVAFGAITVLRSAVASGGEVSYLEAASLTGQTFLNYLTTSCGVQSLSGRVRVHSRGERAVGVFHPYDQLFWKFFPRPQSTGKVYRGGAGSSWL